MDVRRRTGNRSRFRHMLANARPRNGTQEEEKEEKEETQRKATEYYVLKDEETK